MVNTCPRQSAIVRAALPPPPPPSPPPPAPAPGHVRPSQISYMCRNPVGKHDVTAAPRTHKTATISESETAPECRSRVREMYTSLHCSAARFCSTLQQTADGEALEKNMSPAPPRPPPAARCTIHARITDEILYNNKRKTKKKHHDHRRRVRSAPRSTLIDCYA